MDRPELRQALREIVEEATGEPGADLAEDQDLREGLGLDSVDLFSLIIETQSRFGIKIVTDDLRDVAVVGDFLDLVEAKLADKAGPRAT